VAVAQQNNDEAGKAGEAFREALDRVMIPKSRLTNGPQVRRAFREAVADTALATVRVRCDGKDAALGGIVGPDGWIVSKASQLSGQVTCRLKDGRELDARVVGVDREYDLAMLKVAAKELPVVDMLRDTDGDVGQWVATVGIDDDPVAVGVLSVDTRRIRHQPGILGVQLDQVKEGARIVKVFPDTAAANAGILVNDIISAVNGTETANREALVQEIRKYSPGDEVELGVIRDGKEMTLIAILTGQPEGMEPTNRRDYQNSLGSELSQRRFGFPHAFQHDTVLKVTDCGGPLVNLDGKVVGFNVSRSGRTESYAIPCNVVVTRLFDMMSGAMAPRQNEDLTKPLEPMPDEAEEQASTEASE
jgi:serine protease Do